MPKLLDTSVLIRYWGQCRRHSYPDRITVAEVEAWADQLARLYRTRAIVTPVEVEFLAGVRNQDELRLAQAYLGRFEVLDDGHVTPTDWNVAIQLARRVPRDGKPRQLGDCLIRALAKRLKYDVESLDERFFR